MAKRSKADITSGVFENSDETLGSDGKERNYHTEYVLTRYDLIR